MKSNSFLSRVCCAQTRIIIFYLYKIFSSAQRRKYELRYLRPAHSGETWTKCAEQRKDGKRKEKRSKREQKQNGGRKQAEGMKGKKKEGTEQKKKESRTEGKRGRKGKQYLNACARMMQESPTQGSGPGERPAQAAGV